ncbi:MAG: hypothetical protein WC840_01715 [Candidatus Peribacteraceae bacterium]
MSPKNDDITLKTILEHMRGMEERLRTEISGVRTELKGDIREVKNEIRRVEAVLSNQISNIDARLDDIEVVQVPKLKKAVGMGRN